MCAISSAPPIDEERLQTLAKRGAEPLKADITDQAALSRAFSGARAVYLMIPPDNGSPDYVAYQQRVVGALVEAANVGSEIRSGA